MGLLDGTFRTLAGTLGNVLGGDATLTKVTEGYSLVDGVEVPEKTEHPVKVFPPEQYDEREIDNTNVMAGDLKIGIAATELDEVPVTGENGVQWFLTRGSDTFRVVSVSRVEGGDLAVMYELQCRR